MSNERYGTQVIDGKIYIDGVEYKSGSEDVHNEFNKICVYGTSIEATPSGSNSWSGFMARKLGLTFGTNVINHGKGGGGVTWYANDVRITETITAYKSHVLAAFSCSTEEKQAAADYFLSQGLITQAEIDAAKAGQDWNLCYTKSLLEEEDVDLYIFGTYGINDRMPWMTWTDENGNEQTSFTVHKDLAFDRRTIYGAYNYVLRALYQQNPNAKVVILGQHTRQWDVDGHSQTCVNGIQRAVAETWQIPFADWGESLSLNQIFYGATNVHVGQSDVKRTIFTQDAVHPTTDGAELLGTWVAKWITETKLVNMSPRFITL